MLTVGKGSYVSRKRPDEPVVITGIGMLTSVGNDRESVWSAVKQGRSGVQKVTGLRGIEDGRFIGGVVNLKDPVQGRLKVLPMCQIAAQEAIADSAIDLDAVDKDRFACALSAHMGDSRWVDEQMGFLPANDPNRVAWWRQWFPNTACMTLAHEYALNGPRLAFSTACASGLISIHSAVRAIRDGQCDIALTGGGDAIDPLFAAGFRSMRVLAFDDVPERACRPFDKNRSGFVLGEGAAIFVVERLSHALARGARIYAEIASTGAMAEAHHVTGLDAESEALTHLILTTLKKGRLRREDIGYINAHGTGTKQNDLVEMRAIRRALGPAADDVCVSASKSMLGHMINAAGCVELAITVMAMRDGFAPPTINLHDPDPECTFDCLPLEGRPNRFQHAMKLSVAFGGHLVAVALKRWNDSRTGFAYPNEERAA